LRKLIYAILLGLGLFVVFGLSDKDRQKQKSEFKPIEVVTDVKPDSVFSNKYVVRIKRIEVVESEFWLHTDKKYKVGDVYTTFF
jgi:hypothetical protein